MSEATVEHLSDDRRFEITTEGEVAGFADYRDDSGRRIFFHTVVEDRFGGRGLAGQLIGAALDQTREDGLKAVPVCSFVEGYLAKHPEYADVAAPVTDEDKAIVGR